MSPDSEQKPTVHWSKCSPTPHLLGGDCAEASAQGWSSLNHPNQLQQKYWCLKRDVFKTNWSLNTSVGKEARQTKERSRKMEIHKKKVGM